MRVRCTAGPIDTIPVDTVCVSFFADERPLQGSAGLVDWRLCALISRSILAGQVRGDLGEKLLVHAGGRIAAGRVLAVGTGFVNQFTYERMTGVLAKVVESLHGMQASDAALTLPGVALSGLDYGVAAGRFLEIFARFKDTDWLSRFTAQVVVHKNRLREVHEQIAASAQGMPWVFLER